MTTVSDARKALEKLEAEGLGAFPLVAMEIRDGVPYAYDVAFRKAEEHDGDLVLVDPVGYGAPPVWMASR